MKKNSNLKSFYKKILFCTILVLTTITIVSCYYRIKFELENLCQKLTNQFLDLEYQSIDSIAKAKHQINNIMLSIQDANIPVLKQIETFISRNHNYYDNYIFLYDKNDKLTFNSKLKSISRKLPSKQKYNTNYLK